MKKYGMILCLVASMGSNAFAQTPNPDELLIWAAGGGSTPATVMLTPAANGDLVLAAPTDATFTIGGQTLTLDIKQVDIGDPHIQIAFGVSNPSGATGFTSQSFTFASPAGSINLAAGQYTVNSSIGGSLTTGGDNRNSTPVVLTTPVGGGAIMQSFVGSSTDVGGRNDAGVDLLDSSTTPITFTPSVAQSNTANIATINSPTLTYNLANPATQISVTTSFQLSNSDSVSFSGRFDITPVTDTTVAPEPGMTALMLAGLGALLLAVRRRTRSQ